MSHPLFELANDRAVRQAAQFHQAAADLGAERLAEALAAERDAAPRLEEAGRRYFVSRSGKPPTERRKNKDEEHLGAALVRYCREADRGLPLPDDEGYLLPLDYQIRVKAGPADDVATKGIGRIDLLAVGPEERLVVVKLRHLEPSATRCRVGDTPLRLLLEGLGYTAIVQANREAIVREVAERFGRTLADAPPRLAVVATPRYWELCRKRATQRGAAWIKEVERLAGDAAGSLDAPVEFLSLRLEGDPGWSYDDAGPLLDGPARLYPAWEPGAGRIRPKPKPRARQKTEAVDEVVEADLSRPPRPYRITESYSAGDRIEHPKLGTGVVQGLAGPGKIRVHFDERQSVLVHERSA